MTAVAEKLSESAERLHKLKALGDVDPDNTYIPYNLLADFGITFSRIHVMRLVARGKFPAPVRPSERKIAWRLSELRLWQRGEHPTNKTSAVQ
jgi:hypothetical protein